MHINKWCNKNVATKVFTIVTEYPLYKLNLQMKQQRLEHNKEMLKYESEYKYEPYSGKHIVIYKNNEDDSNYQYTCLMRNYNMINKAMCDHISQYPNAEKIIHIRDDGNINELWSVLKIMRRNEIIFNHKHFDLLGKYTQQNLVNDITKIKNSFIS